MPLTYYTEAEVQVLKERIRQLSATNEALEALRPVWAQGWTSDSAAAQASGNALARLWGELGVSNQTEAMQRMRQLKGAEVLYNEIHKVGR